MNKSLRGLLCLVLLLGALGPGLPRPMEAATVAPVESGVYTEDFSTYINMASALYAQWDIWSQRLSLSAQDSVEQYAVAASTDGLGGVYIIWNDSRAGSWDIYGQHLDANGNPLWPMDVRINSDSGLANQFYSAIAIDSGGNAFVVWHDNRNGHWDIFGQKLTATGEKMWPDDICINTDATTSSQTVPAIGINQNDEAIVVWRDARTGNTRIYSQKISSNGDQLWGSDVPLSSNDMATHHDSPALAIDVDGSFVVSWQSTADADVYAQRFDANGSELCPVAVRLNPEVSGEQRNPAIVIDDSGHAVIAWEDNRNGRFDVYAQSLDSDCSLEWVADALINSNAGVTDHRHPGMGLDAQGNILIAWWDSAGAVYAQKLDTEGHNLWTEDTLLNDSYEEPAGQDQLAVVEDEQGGSFIVWQAYTNWDIHIQKLGLTGAQLWPNARSVNRGLGQVYQGNPDLIAWGDSIAVVWGDERNSTSWNDSDIYLGRFDQSGNTLWNTDIRVNSDTQPANQRYPSIASNDSGVSVVVWWDEREAQSDLYAQRIDSNGNLCWAGDIRVTDIAAVVSVNSGYPRVSLDENGNAIVVWIDYRNGRSDVYAQKVDRDGQHMWENDVLVNAGLSGSPVVAVDSYGSAVIAWVDSRSGDLDIYAQRLGADGGKLWSTEIQVNSSDAAGNQKSPSITADSEGNTVVAWDDGREASLYSLDIYAQKLNPNGARLWASDVRVNGDTAIAVQVAPDIAIDTDGNIVVVWQENYPFFDVFAQKLTASGTGVWGNGLRVNTDEGSATQRYPAVVMGPGGNAFVVWEDWRKGNQDIYAQSISQVGVRAWMTDLHIAVPDRFYYLVGEVASQPVDAVQDIIRQATLTADLQLNGGIVQFSLTNDGGTNWTAVTPGITHVFTTTGSEMRWRAELTGDPVWRHRSPVVNSLRIEYSTQEPYADDYEPDDTCAQAQPLAVNGAVQAHTFHQYADEDWAWFDVISGTTYIVQTSNTQANADTTLELRATCPQPPFAGDDNVFGQDARITWQATFSGTVYVKVSHHDPAVYGADTGYDLSVRTFTQPPVAVIVAGHDNSYSLQNNIDTMADMAYRTFLNSGVPKSNIRYFGPNPARDVDGNGLHDDLYATVTITGVRDTVQDWSREQGVQLGVPFYVYLVDHGHYDQFLAAGSANKVWATDLNLWLSNLEATSGADNINVILEACKSGSFIDVTTLGPAEVSGHNRVVIASTSSTLNAYPSAQGGYFSDVFWTAVGQNQDLKTAFEWAKQAVQATELSQQPWLDDNGDAVADGQDGALARGRGLGGAFAGSPPVIDWAQVEEASGQATIQAQVRDDFGVELVWAEVYAPDFVEPPPSQDGTTPLVNVPTTTLTLAGSDLYGATYTLTQTGNYRLVVYALDDEGNLALPQAVRLCVGCTLVYLPLVLRGK